MAAQAVESHPEVVAHACTPGHQARRSAERFGALAEPLLLREQEPERVVELTLVGSALEPLAQHSLRFRVSSHRVVEGDQVGPRRTEVRIHAERGEVLGFREIALALARVEHGQVEMTGRHVGHRVLRLHELRDGRVESRALLPVEAVRRHRDENARRLDAHRPQLVFEQGRHHPDALRGREALEGSHRGDATSCR